MLQAVILAKPKSKLRLPSLIVLPLIMVSMGLLLNDFLSTKSFVGYFGADLMRSGIAAEVLLGVLIGGFGWWIGRQLKPIKR